MKQASALYLKRKSNGDIYSTYSSSTKMKELSAGHVWEQMFILTPNLSSL